MTRREFVVPGIAPQSGIFFPEISWELGAALSRAPGQSSGALENLKQGVIIAIPGHRIGRLDSRNHRVQADRPHRQFTEGALAPDGWQAKGDLVHERDLGTAEEQGFKGISILRNELKGALRNLDIIKNHYHGNYSLEPNVIIGECAVDSCLRSVTKRYQASPDSFSNPSFIPEKSEGNSKEFPAHRHRRPAKAGVYRLPLIAKHPVVYGQIFYAFFRSYPNSFWKSHSSIAEGRRVDSRSAFRKIWFFQSPSACN